MLARAPPLVAGGIWGFASFNMGWAGTPGEFNRYVSVCSVPAVNYCDTRPRIDRGATVATDAEKARAAKCQQDTVAAAGGRDASMPDLS